LHDRTVESLGLLYAMHWPYRQPETARGVRRSPVHDRLAARGACFGEAAGWERANWFATGEMTAAYQYSYGRQNWFDCSGEEHHAVRTDIGLFDQTSFAKFRLEGPDAERVLNQICANDIAVPVGKIVYTQWLNDNGGIEADLTVTREGEDRFMIVTAAATQVRDFHWLNDHIGTNDWAIAVDLTSGAAVFSVMGPNSRTFLQALTPADLSNAAFPFGTSQEIDLGYARVRASRITYVGELGWEIYAPAEFAAGVFDALTEGSSNDGGPRLAGYHALNSLRMEKGYRHWGHDITPDDTPLEAGLGFAVAWDKPDGFIGKDALVRQREAGVARRLVQLALVDSDKLLYHNEPIWRDGSIVGETSSGMWGHTVQQSLAMGYVANPDGVADAAYIDEGTYEVEVAGERVPARASLQPFYDPKSLRVKA
jgi:glycine cleavage system T protein